MVPIARSSLMVTALSLAVAHSTPAHASVAPSPQVVIDFEAAYDGSIPVEGDDASTLWSPLGATFYLVGSIEPPVIAVEGAPTQGYVWRDAADTIYRDEAVSGLHTLTDPWSTSGAAELGVAFSVPVDSVSILVIDFGEAIGAVQPGDPMTFALQAFDAAGALVDEDTFTISAYNPRDPSDGNVAELSVSAPHIAYVQTVGGTGDWGLSYDDLIFTLADADGDGVLAGDDLCPATVTDVAAGVPAWWLGRNRWADTNEDGGFEFGGGWTPPWLAGLDLADTGGCSCADIIDAVGLGRPAQRFGCHSVVMSWWSWFVVP